MFNSCVDKTNTCCANKWRFTLLIMQKYLMTKNNWECKNHTSYKTSRTTRRHFSCHWLLTQNMQESIHMHFYGFNKQAMLTESSEKKSWIGRVGSPRDTWNLIIQFIYTPGQNLKTIWKIIKTLISCWNIINALSQDVCKTTTKSVRCFWPAVKWPLLTFSH